MGNKTSISIDYPTTNVPTMNDIEASKGVGKGPKTFSSLNIADTIKMGVLSFNNDEFDTLDKNIYRDVQKKLFRGAKHCCTINDNFYYDDNNELKSCDYKAISTNTDYCLEFINDLCLNETPHERCNMWIETSVKYNKIEEIINYCKNMNEPNSQCITFIYSLRKFANNINNYNNEADKLLFEYYQNGLDLPCAFSTNYNNYECYESNCIFSPSWKLSSKNLNNLKNCSFNICDFNVDLTNANNLNVDTKCYTELKIEDISQTSEESFLRDFQLPFNLPSTSLCLAFLLILAMTTIE